MEVAFYQNIANSFNGSSPDNPGSDASLHAEGSIQPLTCMKNLLKLEEAAMFGLSIYLFTLTSFSWWWYPALLLLPDIGMIGYVINTRVGALTYNVLHHKGLAVVILLAGWYFAADALALSGIILFGHASMDRLFGYGLKYPDHFQHTSLGWMKAQSVPNDEN